jgi:FkbM family methyltransferase
MKSNKELVDVAKALYEKIQSGKLESSDILSVSEAQFLQNTEFVRQLHKDRALFEKHFSSFMVPFGIFRIFGSDATILDVGAHWGYSALAIRYQGAGARIVSVEALEQNTRELAVLKALENGRYDFIHAAATESASELTFYIPSVNGVAVTGLTSTGGTLTDYFAEMFAGFVSSYPAKSGQSDRLQIVVQKVKGLPIDQIAENLGLTQSVQAIKMDVEGHEAPALRGARKLIQQQHPLIMIEGANRDVGVISELSSHGYAHYDQIDGKLYPQEAYSTFNDGYWLHPQHLDYYRHSGIIG